MRVYVHTCLWLCTCVSMSMHSGIDVCLCPHLSVSTCGCVHMNLWQCPCMSVSMRVYDSVHMGLCPCVFVSTWVYLYPWESVSIQVCVTWPLAVLHICVHAHLYPCTSVSTCGRGCVWVWVQPWLWLCPRTSVSTCGRGCMHHGSRHSEVQTVLVSEQPDRGCQTHFSLNIWYSPKETLLT